MVAERLHILDGDAQQLGGVIRPGQPHELHEGHHVLAVRALGMRRLPAGYPGLKATGYGKIELLDALVDGGGLRAHEDRRESGLHSFCSELGH